MRKGVYLTTERGIKKGSGAYKHVQVGVEELAKNFEIILCNKAEAVEVPGSSTTLAKQKSGGNTFKSRVIQFIKANLKGLYLIYNENRGFIKDYRWLKKIQPDFVYERAAYLSFKGKWLAYLLRIPHFYEVNGILWLDHAQYFPAWWNRVARSLEDFHYRRSSHVFFVGGIAKYFKVPAERASSIQNGIERPFAEQFIGLKKEVQLPLQIVFIGHAMPHHKVEVFCNATHLVKDASLFHLHFIGAGLEQYKSLLHPAWNVHFHGIQDHNNIARLLKQYHIGIVPFVKDYFSNVKIFMYGAAKLAVIAPMLGNIADIFTNDELIAIQNEDPEDIARQLDWASQHLAEVAGTGEQCFQKVYSQFTWDNIYADVAAIIKERIG